MEKGKHRSADTKTGRAWSILSCVIVCRVRAPRQGRYSAKSPISEDIWKKVGDAIMESWRGSVIYLANRWPVRKGRQQQGYMSPHGSGSIYLECSARTFHMGMVRRIWNVPRVQQFHNVCLHMYIDLFVECPGWSLHVWFWCLLICAWDEINGFWAWLYTLSAHPRNFEGKKTWNWTVWKRCFEKPSSWSCCMNGGGNCYPPHSYSKIINMISRSHFWIDFWKKLFQKMTEWNQKFYFISFFFHIVFIYLN